MVRYLKENKYNRIFFFGLTLCVIVVLKMTEKREYEQEIRLLRTELKNLRNQIRGLRAQHQKDIFKLHSNSILRFLSTKPKIGHSKIRMY